MADSSSQTGERVQTVVTVLIALVSTAIALVASQAAVAIGNTTEAQHNGVLAKINLERVDGGNRVVLEQYLRNFDQYRFNRRLWSLTFDYIGQAYDAGNLEYEKRLRQEAAALLEESSIALNLIDGYYLIPGSNSDEPYSGFDGEQFLSAGRQRAAIYQDLDSADNFAAADQTRTQALAMNASLIVLFIGVMFLTWAQISRSALRWVWLAAGLLVLLGTGAGYVIAAVMKVVGL